MPHRQLEEAVAVGLDVVQEFTASTSVEVLELVICPLHPIRYAVQKAILQSMGPAEARKGHKETREDYRMVGFMQESKDWALLRSQQERFKVKKGSISFALILALPFKNKFSNLQLKAG